MAKRDFSQVRTGGAAGAPEEEGAADLLASKMLLSLASAPVVHPNGENPSDDSSCAVSVSTTRSAARPESAGSGGGESKDFESGEDEEIGVGEEDGDTMMSGMESRSSSPVSEDGEGDRKRSRGLPRSIKSITLDELRLYFDKPIEEAAKMIGICSTLLKKICRKYNIKRWPYRQIKSLDRTIDCLKIAAANAKPGEQERFVSQIRLLETRRTELIESSSTPGGPRPAPLDHEAAGAALMADITSLQRRAVSLGKPFTSRKPPSPPSSSSASSSSSSTPLAPAAAPSPCENVNTANLAAPLAPVPHADWLLHAPFPHPFAFLQPPVPFQPPSTKHITSPPPAAAAATSPAPLPFALLRSPTHPAGGPSLAEQHNAMMLQRMQLAQHMAQLSQASTLQQQMAQLSHASQMQHQWSQMQQHMANAVAAQPGFPFLPMGFMGGVGPVMPAGMAPLLLADPAQLSRTLAVLREQQQRLQQPQP